MSDDDPVERFVEDTFDGVDEDDGEVSVPAPKARDMEAELRERTGVSANPDTEDLEVDADVATPFWAAVLYVNVGILLLAVGPLLYVARGQGLVSLALVGAGVALLFRAYLVYRNFRAEREAEEGDPDAVETGDDDTERDDSR